MKKELCYIFLSFILISTAVVAQEHGKDEPYLIQNKLPCTLTIDTKKTGVQDILPNSTLLLHKDEFPFHVGSYCSGGGSPGYDIIHGDKNKEYPLGCYHINDSYDPSTATQNESPSAAIQDESTKYFMLTLFDCPKN